MPMATRMTVNARTRNLLVAQNSTILSIMSFSHFRHTHVHPFVPFLSFGAGRFRIHSRNGGLQLAFRVDQKNGVCGDSFSLSQSRKDNVLVFRFGAECDLQRLKPALAMDDENDLTEAGVDDGRFWHGHFFTQVGLDLRIEKNARSDFSSGIWNLDPDFGRPRHGIENRFDPRNRSFNTLPRG